MFTIPIIKAHPSITDISKVTERVNDMCYVDRLKYLLQLEYNMYDNANQDDNERQLKSVNSGNEFNGYNDYNDHHGYNRKISVLYIDDEGNNLNGFKASFRKVYTIYTASNRQEAFDLLAKYMIDVVISDVRMPDCNGVDLLIEIKELYPNVSRVLISAYTDSDVLIDAINKAAVVRYIAKPWKEQDVHDAILVACPPILV